MKLSKLLGKLKLVVEKEKYSELKKEAKNVCDELKRSIKKNNLQADLFLGGSFAKETMLASGSYEIDVFIRFDKKYEDLSKELELIVKEMNSYNVEKIHGSRDYFKIFKNDNLIFEIIPVLKISKPDQARNVTDLSYFHVNYVRRKSNEKIRNNIVIAKAFCKACGIYGAESYIQGFSGYALECLVIHYGGFEKMLKAVLKTNKKIVIDSKKWYNKKNIIIELNESKSKGPIILIDPTWKERNVLAALNEDSFKIFIENAKKLLKKPEDKYFEFVEFDPKKFYNKNKSNEVIKFIIETNKQEGDIAATKMKKFFIYFLSEAKKLEIKDKVFNYSGGQSAEAYVSVKKKKEIIKTGPPIEMKEASLKFREQNKNCFEKSKRLYSRVGFDESIIEYFNQVIKNTDKTRHEMGINKIELVEL